jgi:hypothetical protein
MKKQLHLFSLITLFSFAMANQVSAQDKSKEATVLAQRKKQEFRDSITTKMTLVRQKYQRQIDSLISNNHLEGKEKWERINALTKERNLSIWQLTELVKAKNSFREIKQ